MKESAPHVSLNSFCSPWLRYAIKTNYIKFQTLKFDFLKKGLGLVPPPHFVCGFSKKIFLSLSDYLYFLRYWAIYVSKLIIFQFRRHWDVINIIDVIKFWDELSCQAIFLHDGKSQDKNLNIWRTKRFFKVK